MSPRWRPTRMVKVGARQKGRDSSGGVKRPNYEVGLLIEGFDFRRR